MRILIIDIDPAYEGLYRKKLAFSKFNLDFVKSIPEALKKFSKKKYDLVLIGHYLKNSSGVEACETLRAAGYQGNIIITAPGNHLKEIRACYSNICEVINKGTNADDFIKILKKYVPIMETTV